MNFRVMSLPFCARLEPGQIATLAQQVPSGVGAFRGERFRIAGIKRLWSIGRPWGKRKGWVTRQEVVGPTVEVLNISVGVVEQLSGAVPAVLFGDDGSWPMSVAMQATIITVRVHNYGPRLVDFRSSLTGTALVGQS